MKKLNTPRYYSITKNVFYRTQKPYKHILLILFCPLNEILPENSCLHTIKFYKRKSPKCLVSWGVGKRGRGWERRVENLLLHSASLTLLPLSKLHKTP